MKTSGKAKKIARRIRTRYLPAVRRCGRLIRVRAVRRPLAPCLWRWSSWSALLAGEVALDEGHGQHEEEEHQ